MANRTDKSAASIHGKNPQFLVEKIIRARIYDAKYWKESCFALTGMLFFVERLSEDE
jgi:pre-mRNA-splicing factor 38A